MITICLLTIHPKGVEAIRSEMEHGLEVNPEGAGWAILCNGSVHSGKGLNGKFELDTYLLLREKMGNPPGVFHARLATAGRGLGYSGCHPLDVPGTDLKVFHNGTLPGEFWDADDPRSDTRQFAEDWLPGRAVWASEGTLAAKLADMIGPFNKMVLAGPRGLLVINEQEFLTTPEGALHSNADYLGQGEGWDEMTIGGDLYRYNLPQPGQCETCNRLSCAGKAECDGTRQKHPPRWRNESARRASLAVA